MVFELLPIISIGLLILGLVITVVNGYYKTWNGVLAGAIITLVGIAASVATYTEAAMDVLIVLFGPGVVEFLINGSTILILVGVTVVLLALVVRVVNKGP